MTRLSLREVRDRLRDAAKIRAQRRRELRRRAKQHSASLAAHQFPDTFTPMRHRHHENSVADISPDRIAGLRSLRDPTKPTVTDREWELAERARIDAKREEESRAATRNRARHGDRRRPARGRAAAQAETGDEE